MKSQVPKKPRSRRTGNEDRRSGFGSVRRLPSGRFRATYRRYAKTHKAPTTFLTEEQAWEWLAKISATINAGRDPEPELTVREAGERWVVSDPRKSDSSWTRDEGILRNHIYPAMGEMRVGSVTRGRVQELVNHWDGASIKRRYGTLRALFGYVELNGWITTTPCRRIRLPKDSDKEFYPLTPGEVGLIRNATTDKYKLAITVSAVCGLRWNETFGLQVGDVDVPGQRIVVRRGLTKNRAGATVVAQSGSTKSRLRSIPIPAWLCEALQAHGESIGDADPPWLFPAPRGGLAQYNNFRDRAWQPALAKAGLDKVAPAIGFHDLRRFAATYLIGTGADPVTVKSLFGHADARLVLERYAHPLEAVQRAATERLGDLVKTEEMSQDSRTTSDAAVDSEIESPA